METEKNNSVHSDSGTAFQPIPNTNSSGQIETEQHFLLQSPKFEVWVAVSHVPELTRRKLRSSTGRPRPGTRLDVAGGGGIGASRCSGRHHGRLRPRGVRGGPRPLKGRSRDPLCWRVQNCNSAEITSDECCPACKERGQIQALRTYHISFQESIFLCENPQCIYPLGYKPLNSIIIPADSENHQTQGTERKRKIFEISPTASPIESCSKQARTNNNLIDAEHTLNTDLVVQRNGYNLCVTQPCLPDLSPDDQQKHNRTTESLEHNVDLATAITVGGVQESPDSNSKTELFPNSELCSIKSEILHIESKSSFFTGHLCLQWRNIYALCWLDCILSALVHLKTLRIAVTEACTEESVIQRLFTKYNQATALLNACQTNKLKDAINQSPIALPSTAELQLGERWKQGRQGSRSAPRGCTMFFQKLSHI
ncbi:SUMO-specific isopeptidase USPL1 [Chelonoidis abingdonii]|uniref:SUMO-specific isopeptidase USPL1 n=1 Tax=Chelonoidis abingdonii TaxID=106734 RepID=UPI003F49861D